MPSVPSIQILHQMLRGAKTNQNVLPNTLLRPHHGMGISCKTQRMGRGWGGQGGS